MTPAGIEKRLAAWLLDVVVFVPLALLAVDGFRQWVYGATGRPSFRFTGLAGSVRPEDSFTLGVALALLVYTASEAVAGLSVGKLAFGLRVGRRDGSRAGRQRMFARWFVKYLPVIAYLALFGTELALFRTAGYVLAEESRLTWHLVRLVLGAIGLAYGMALVASVLLVMLPVRRAVHDLLTGTAVFDFPLREPAGGFEAIAVQPTGRPPATSA